MLIFLKLGGSLITDKRSAQTPRPEVILRLAGEIARARQEDPSLSLIIGHGSGSYGHMVGNQYNTRHGVKTTEQWLGFAKVWHAARLLNQLVIERLIQADIPAIAFPPSSMVTAEGGAVSSWDLYPIQSALEHGLVPLVYGDVVFDNAWGGTILSTEDLFYHLAQHLSPSKILLAGIEAGVWADFPACTQLIPLITPEKYLSITGQVKGSTATDVTGGMAHKVEMMLKLLEFLPTLQSSIFSGKEPGQVYHALTGSTPGTLIKA